VVFTVLEEGAIVNALHYLQGAESHTGFYVSARPS
jgi:hypothetical protein